MIKGLAITTVWVLDQDRAKEFYTEKLGMEVRTDLRMGGEDGMRWLTVGAKDQPEVELTLMVPGPPGMDPEAGESLKQLVSKGLMGAGVLRTDDVKADYAALKAKGVEFLQEPQERPVRHRSDLPRRLRQLVLAHPAQRTARPEQGVGRLRGVGERRDWVLMRFRSDRPVTGPAAG
ncbi:hypothetical protein SRIMM317S_01078 [Streptomyces rimosus subsp. rimosus]